MAKNFLQTEEQFIKLVKGIALKSSANKRQVGALIHTKQNSLIEGYNRNPSNDKFFTNEICENSKGETFDTVIHAEEDAIFTAFLQHENLLDATLYCTFTPCINCSRMIVRSGISRLVYINEHKTNFKTPGVEEGVSPQEYLESYGIEVIKYIEPKKHRIALIYHSADPDGLMSAYLLAAIYQPLASETHIIPSLIPSNYRDNEDWLFEEYDEYVFGDITPPLSWIKENYHKIYNEHLPVKIYDHHENRCTEMFKVYPELFKLKSFQYTYDNTCSGAKIIHNNLSKDFIFLNDNALSMMINLISDYDLWKFDQKNYEINQKEIVLAFNEFLFHNLNFDDFFKIISDILNFDVNIYGHGSNYQNALLKGQQYIENTKSENKRIISMGKFVGRNFIFNGYPNYWITEQIKEIYPDFNINNLGYLVGFNINISKDTVSFSIRSYKNKLNCVIVAQKFGGNGHKDAAGFKSTFIDAAEILQNPEKLFDTLIVS